MLSKSTQTYDRTEKFRYYRSIAEFQEYVLISQYEIQIEQYSRREDSSWLFRDYDAEAKILQLDSVNVEMSIADLYEGVEFGLEDAE